MESGMLAQCPRDFLEELSGGTLTLPHSPFC